MESICDQHRAGERLTYRLGVGGGQVHAHVGDPRPPALRLRVQPRDRCGAGPALNLGEEPASARGVNEPGMPPVTGQHPPFRVRILGPDRFTAAGLIDAQDAHRW